MALLDDKVALVTGAARGQGRSHALRMAAEGADIIAIDICADIESIPYPLGTSAELDDLAREIKGLGRRVVARQADIRDEDRLRAAIGDGIAELGGPDIVVANAGVAPMARTEAPNAWRDVVDVNLSGTFHTVEAALPAMLEHGRGGSIVLTSSTAGLSGSCGLSRGGLGYVASKHGVVGLMRSYANYLAPHSIRVNTVHPTGVLTGMVDNPAVRDFVASNPSLSGDGNGGGPNAMPVPILQASDITDAVLWLVSDQARYVTGVALPVDGGFLAKR
ncbi:mycofactocin-coupled SDR family oxidoreductase [Jatrophihabitans fulvus]